MCKEVSTLMRYQRGICIHYVNSNLGFASEQRPKQVGLHASSATEHCLVLDGPNQDQRHGPDSHRTQKTSGATLGQLHGQSDTAPRHRKGYQRFRFRPVDGQLRYL